MTNSNKQLGNTFEEELCQMLFDNGFWSHNLAMNKAGQPADVIAVKNGKAYLIDAKVCSDGLFKLSRVEENQELAMTLWKDCGNGEGWFAFKINDRIYMLPHIVVKAYKAMQSTMPYSEICEVGTPFEKWVKKCK